jgi:small-conductance mechanosensitive channel
MKRLLKLLCVVLMLGLGTATPVVIATGADAQQSMQGPDYEAWEALATRVEDALESGDVSTPILEDLRRLLVDGRQDFIDAQGTNSATIKTVRDQLAALGPPPEDGSEPPDISAQREELNRRLARLEAPVRTAEVAQRRADGLISAIDETINARQTEELLRLGPAPVNPQLWPEAVTSLYSLVNDIRSEVLQTWQRPAGYQSLIDNLPAVLGLLLPGLLLFARGRVWTVRLLRKVRKEEPSAGRWIATFLISLGAWGLPFMGIVAIVQAAQISGLPGPMGDLVLTNLLPAAFIFFLARWLAQRLFPRHEPRGPIFNLDEGCRSAGRLYGAFLGLVVAGFHLVTSVSEGARWSEPATNVVIFPLLVLTGLLLWRMSSLLKQHSRAYENDPASEPRVSDRIAGLLSRLLTVVAVAAPVLAAIGYMNAAEAIMLPAALSLILLAVLLVLQRFLSELYVLLTGNRISADESLVPVLGGFFLGVLSLPAFALIWGARPAQLRQVWTSITEGVSIGGTTISPTIFLTLAIVFAIGLLITRLLQGALRTTILPKTKLDTGGRNAIVSGVGYVGIFLAVLISITSAGIDLSSLAIVAGALSVGIGFGLQNIVSNFVAGIILLIERPISEGDWIEVGGQHGYVKAISVRSTRIETFDRTDVIVPNADFVSGTVTNFTRGNTVGRVIVPVGVAYGSDSRKVEAILREIAEDHPLVLMNPPPTILFRGFGSSTLDFEIRAILRDVNWMMDVHSEMNHHIARRFAEEGIEIPFPQQEIWIRKEAAPTGQAASRSAAGSTSGAPNRVPPEKAVSDFEGDGDGDGGGGDGGGR